MILINKSGLAARATVIATLLAAAGIFGIPADPPTGQVDGWPYYGHDAGGMRYSPLAEINRENVGQLKPAWIFHTGDISDGRDFRGRTGFETTPLVVDNTLYLTTPFNRVIALDPETGKQRWAYDPLVDPTEPYGDGLINRGVATWMDAALPRGIPCHRRIYECTLDARLIALDAATGAPCGDFGQYGQVSLRDVARYREGSYHMTSPPAVVDDLVVVGSAIDDNSRVDMPSGVVRAFDARSGALRWNWDPVPPNASRSDDGNNTWNTGAANAWSVMSVDRERHLVFVPTGSASPDYYGGLRPGDDKWADSVVAIDSRNGKMKWGFQLVHHDLWDYDSAAPPLLATLRRGARQIPAVIQGNKTGFLYVLDRNTGAPVFPVSERSVPQTNVPGESTSPTQPIPETPPALVPQQLSADDVWGATPADRKACRNMVQSLKNTGVFTPPGTEETLVVPGNVGGMNWSGYAFDPERQLLFVNVTNLPFVVRLIPRARFNESREHGPGGEYSAQTGAPYGMYRRPLLSPGARLPCSKPPWGALAAVNLSTGKIQWQVPLGSMLPGHADTPLGAPSLGGAIVTGGGLVFVAGTIFDPFIRAFDVDTGRELWKGRLPAPGGATPITYRLGMDRKQYVVVAAGGHSKVTEEAQSDSLVAFTLP